MNSGLLLIRLVFGLLMAGHGARKLFGWFGGHGLTATANVVGSIGFRPPRLFASLAAGSEFFGGLLVALGLFWPVGPALMVSVMVVAISVHWGKGVFALTNGIELPSLYAAAATALALAGPGAFSIDRLAGLTFLSGEPVADAMLAVAVVAGFVNIAIRHAGPASAPQKAG